jgi:hypothetical protein
MTPQSTQFSKIGAVRSTLTTWRVDFNELAQVLISRRQAGACHASRTTRFACGSRAGIRRRTASLADHDDRIDRARRYFAEVQGAQVVLYLSFLRLSAEFAALGGLCASPAPASGTLQNRVAGTWVRVRRGQARRKKLTCAGGRHPRCRPEQGTAQLPAWRLA